MQTAHFATETGDGAGAGDAVIDIASPYENTCITLEGIALSYSATPTAGRLLIESPVGETKLDVDITGSGLGPFQPAISGLQGSEGEAMRVTLFDGGSGIVSKLNVYVHE